MIRFVLFVACCYKFSCQEKQKRGQTSHFIPDVVLTMPDVFVCPSIKQDIERFVEHFRGSTVGVVYIYRSPDESKVEVEEIVHKGSGVFHYIHEGTFLSNTRNLYMFLPDNVPAILIFGLKNNTYVACLKDETTTRKRTVYACASHSLLTTHFTEKMLVRTDLLQKLKETLQNE